MKVEKFICNLDSECVDSAISYAKKELLKNNSKYKELFFKMSRLKDKYPKIRDILDNEKSSSLNEEEGKVLIDIVNLFYDMQHIEEYEIFLSGGRECFGYLQEIKVI